MSDQLLSIYESDDNFAQFIGVDTYRQIRENRPEDLDRMRNSVYFAERDGLDVMNVFDNYEAHSVSAGLSGDAALDTNTIRENLEKDWKDRKVAASLYEGYESVAKESWANYEDQWTTQYLKSPAIRDAANNIPKELSDLENQLAKTQRGDPKASSLKAEIAKRKTMLRAVTIGRARAAQERLENDAERQSLRFSQDLLKLREAEGLGETIKATTPLNLSQVVLGSLVEGGPATPLVAATAPVTGPLGLAISSGAAAFNQELSASVEAELASIGIDLSNLETLEQQITENEKEIQAAYVSASKKAIPVAIAAMIGGRDFGGKTLVTRGLRDIGAQTTLDVMGETLGQLWQTGDVDAAEVYMEAIAGIGQNASEFGGKIGYNLVSDKYKSTIQNADGTNPTPQQWEQIGQAVSDEEVASLGLSPLEESLTLLAKSGDKNAQNMLNELTAPQDTEPVAQRPTPFLERMALAVEKGGANIDKGIQKAVSLSTRIGEISTDAKLAVEKIDFDTTTFSNKGTAKTDPFIDSVNRARKGMSKDEVAALNADILNGNYEALAKRGITNLELVQEFLADRAERLPDIKELENYFPRALRDKNGLMRYLAKDPQGPFSEAITKATKEKGSELTTKETDVVINSVLRRRAASKPGFLKQRTIEKLDPGMTEFYADPLESLRIYNHRTSELIAKRRFLGENVFDPENIDKNAEISEEAIARYVRESIGNITAEQEAELSRLLSSRIQFRVADGILGKLARAYKTGVALKYVSGLKTILVQLSDLAMNAYANGIRDVVGNFVQSTKFVNEFGEEVKATIDEAGIDAVDQELQEALKTGANISQVALFGLRKMDMAMKQNLLSTTARRWTRMAQSSPDALRAELSKTFGDTEFNKKIIKGLKKKKLTADLNFAFFVKLSEFHPTGVSQHTKFYIDRPDLRALFVLKSFAFKRLDFLYRESVRDGIAGFAEATAGALRGDSSSVKSGGAKLGTAVGRMTKILAYMYLAETIIEMMYYQITPREDDDERKFIDTYLDNVSGIFPFFNVWDFKRGVERGKIWEGIVDAFIPPSPVGADPIGEFIESMAEDKPYDWNEIFEEIPWIGQMLVDKEPKGNKKSKNSLFN